MFAAHDNHSRCSSLGVDQKEGSPPLIMERAVIATSSAPPSSDHGPGSPVPVPLLWGPRLRDHVRQKSASGLLVFPRKRADNCRDHHTTGQLQRSIAVQRFQSSKPSAHAAGQFKQYHCFPATRYHVLHPLHDDKENDRVCPHTLVCSKNRRLRDANTFVAYDKHDDRHVLLTIILKSAATMRQVRHVHHAMSTLARAPGFQQLLHVWDHDDVDSARGAGPCWVFEQNYDLSWIPLDLFYDVEDFTEAKLRHITFHVVSMVHFLHAHQLSASGQLCGSQDFMVNVTTNTLVWLISPMLVLSGCLLAHATPSRCVRDVTSIGYLMFHLTMVSHAVALIAAASSTHELERLVQTHLRHLSRPCRAMMLSCLVESPTIEDLIHRRWLRHIDFVTIVPKLDHHIAVAQQHRCLVLTTLWFKLASFFTVDMLGDMHNIAAAPSVAAPSVAASLSAEEEEVESTRRKKQSTKRAYMGRHVSIQSHHCDHHHPNSFHQHHHSLTRAASVGGGNMLKRGMVIMPPLGSAMLPPADDEGDLHSTAGATRSFTIVGSENKLVPGSDDAIHDITGYLPSSQRSAYDSFVYAFPSSPSASPSIPEYDSFDDDNDELFLIETGTGEVLEGDDQGHRPRTSSLLMEENGHSNHSMHSAASLSDLKSVMRSLHHQSSHSRSNGSTVDSNDGHRTLTEAIQARSSAKDGFDPVHLSAFGPSDIAELDKFRIDIWAYLRQQRQEMLETALEVNDSEVAHRVQPMEIARGTRITVSIESNRRLTVVGEDCKSFRWRGEVNGVSFDMQRKRSVNRWQEEDDEDDDADALCIARIVAGTKVSLLFIRLRSSHLNGTTLDEPPTTLLHTRLEHLVSNVPEIAPHDLEPLRPIGKGAFGEAMLALWKEHNTHVVIKAPHSDTMHGDADSMEAFRHEAAVMQMLGKHPHVVELLGITSSDQAAIVTEYLPNGSLHDFLVDSNASGAQASSLSDSSPLSLFSRTVMARDAAHGLVNIHQGHVLHRDIAARNCLLDDKFRVKVCDFGLSRLSSKTSQLFFDDERHGFGPIKWMAPESVLPPHLFSTHSDSYMFGVLLYEIFSGQLPFSGLSSREAMALILEGQHVPIPSHLPVAHHNLMKSCFDAHPLARPTMDQILVTLDQWILQDTRAHSRVPLGIL